MDFTVPMKGARLWSPWDPFLYELEVSTGGSCESVRIGMRSFGFDTLSGTALLNGKKTFLTGTSIDFSRFCEDPERDSLPWNREWVTDLLSGFRDNHWTCFRSVVGFMPEFWYDICDSLGLMVFDEYPIWNSIGREEMMPQTTEQIATEYSIWMHERWNHPCVIVWDAQNETISRRTGEAINMVRGLDIQNRPWDNGFAPPAGPADCKETHPYVVLWYVDPNRPLPEGDFMKWAYTQERLPENGPDQWMPDPSGARYPNATIVNEYAALWLNRDGSATPVTDVIFRRLYGDSLTVEQKREIYARHLAIQTEYWRETRKVAGVLHFQALSYSRPFEPKGVTSDNFIDLRNLVYDPYFIKYVRPSFAPVGLMLQYFEPELACGQSIDVPVAVYNDTYDTYTGTVSLCFMRGEEKIEAGSAEFQADVASNGKEIVHATMKTPGSPGVYELVAELDYGGETVRSYRKIEIR